MIERGYRMTSKEALNRICRLETVDGPEITVGDLLPDCFEVIEKDLEELEKYRRVFIPPVQKLIKDLDRLEKLERYLVKWEEQLGIDGVNSKGMVRADIQFLLKED